MLKWVGLVGCVLIVVAWGVSTTRYLSFITNSCAVSFGKGCFFVSWPDDRLIELALATDRIRKGWNYGVDPRRTVSRDLGFRWPSLCRSSDDSSWFGYLLIPCWLMLPFMAIPTAILWYRDRRPPRGHCQRCGYNLTGNVTGVCSECGEQV